MRVLNAFTKRVDELAAMRCGLLFAVTLLFWLAFTLASVSFAGCVFETNDDRIFSNILSGAYGSELSYQTYFMSLAFTVPVSLLFDIFGTWVNWYVVTCYFLTALAFSLITYIAIRIIGAKKAIIAILAISVLLYYNQFVSFQWTKNASFYASAGMFVYCGLMYSQKKEPIIIWMLAAIIAVAGLSIRPMAALESIAVLVPCAVIAISASARRRRSGDGIQRSLGKPIIVVVVFLAVGLAGIGGTALYFKTDAGWSQWDTFNDAKSELLSFGEVPDYDENEEQINAAGFNRNDWILLSRWGVSDDNVLQPELLESLSSLKGPMVSPSMAGRLVGLAQLITHADIFLLIIALYFVVYATVIKRVRYRSWLYYLPLLICALELVALAIAGNVTNRVLYGPFAALSLAALFFLCASICASEDSRCAAKHASGPAVTALVTGLVLIACVGVSSSARLLEDTEFGWKSEEVAYLLEDQFADNKEILYLVDRPTLSDLETKYMNPLHALDKDAYENVSSLGGWLALTPVDRSTIARHAEQCDAFSNGFEALASGVNVRLVDRYNSKYIEQYIVDHYNPGFSLEKESSIGDITIYSPVNECSNSEEQNE